VSDCGRYLLIEVRKGCDPVNRLYYTDLTTLPDGIKGKLPYVKIVDNFDAEYEVCNSEWSLFFVCLCQFCVAIHYFSSRHNGH